MLLGQAVLTALIDMLLFCLMCNILPIRFLILIISTPIRLLADRGKQQTSIRPSLEPAYTAPPLSARTGLWLTDTAPSVTENTTNHLDSVNEHRLAMKTDELR
jgi:hypothetical protein